MFTNAKKTRIYVVFTLAFTFVYYKYYIPPDNCRLQFGCEYLDETASELLTITEQETVKLSEKQLDETTIKESNRNYEIQNKRISFKQWNDTNENKSNRTKELENKTIVTGKANVHSFYQMSISPSKTLQVQGNSSDTEKNYNDSNSLSHVEELDIVIVNNKVYHKNDIIPASAHKFPILKASGGKFFKKFDFSHYKSKEKKFLKKRAKVMIDRAETLAKVCQDHSMLIKAQKLHLLVWDLKHDPNVIFCPLYKVASTSWMINFLRLVHFNENNPELQHLKPKVKEKRRFSHRYGATQDKVYELYQPPRDRNLWLQTFRWSVRMIIVRHPFTRILSAYRDKMTKMEPLPAEFDFRTLQLQIITKYRPVESTETSPHPTFPEFVQYIIDSSRSLVTAEDWIDKVHCWTPYWAQCNVCGVDYNVIIKLETMQLDEKFLITLTNMEELKELKSEEWKHLNNVSSSEIAADYYKQLSHPQIRQLYQVYRTDFKLFGYTIDDYIQ